MLQIVTFPRFQILLFYDFDLFAVIMRHRKHLYAFQQRYLHIWLEIANRRTGAQSTAFLAFVR